LEGVLPRLKQKFRISRRLAAKSGTWALVRCTAIKRNRGVAFSASTVYTQTVRSDVTT
jgi:hypothetical protein